MKSAAVSILTTIIAPLALIFFGWLANAVTDNQSAISNLKVYKETTQHTLDKVYQEQIIIRDDIKELLQRK